jgi:hypothetical protein
MAVGATVQNESGTFSSVFALHRLIGRQHTDLSSTLLRLHWQSNRCRSQPERKKTSHLRVARLATLLFLMCM